MKDYGLTSNFRYKGNPVRIHVGDDSLLKLSKVLGKVAANKCLVICGQSIAKHTDLLDRVKIQLDDKFAGEFLKVRSDSPLSSVQDGVITAKNSSADCIISIGGGSSVVTARAISIFLAEEGNPYDLCTRYPDDGNPISPRLNKPKVPIIAILTTPTTAVNRAGTAVKDNTDIAISDNKTSPRLEFFDPKTKPKAVIIDPIAFETTPKNLIVNTATSTFCNLIESLQDPCINTMSFSDLRQSLNILRYSLPRVYSSSNNDLDSRIQLAIAALLVNRSEQARSYSNSIGSLSTALVHQIQAFESEIHQGKAKSALLVPCMEFNKSSLLKEQARLAEIWGISNENLSHSYLSDEVMNSINEFLKSVGMNHHLREFDISYNDIDKIATGALNDYFIKNNPREINDVGEIKEFLHTYI